ncbi:MAG TPA: hypothetical protein VKE96_18975 [Vicinamibacterales bacterium]|nr:hypothetical protein [Vicinamibacterales bacterium]
MATSLFTPVLNDRTRAPYFFNGRLLTGEAMTDEQRAQHAAHELLAQGLGDGVAHGLQVSVSTALNTVDRPVVTVKCGAAISRHGDLLLLAADTDVELVRPAHQAAAPQKIFDACKPPQQGTYVADAGVYLLTIAPIGVGNGLAPVSGLGGGNSCNVKYRVDAVQFRLIELPVAREIVADTTRARNRIAYACFGVDNVATFVRDPFGPTHRPHTLLDDVRATGQLTDCDVPLALMYWTATGGVQFIDMWSVRRRLRSRVRDDASLLPDPHLTAIGEPMMRQFNEQVYSMRTAGPLSARAGDAFRWLPPAGLLPLGGMPGSVGFLASTFFTGFTTRGPLFIEGAQLPALLRLASSFPPIEVGDAELVWLYEIRENRQPAASLPAAQPYLVFTLGRVPCQLVPRFDVSHWDYSNYALDCEL